MPSPRVAVLALSYNHAPWMRQSLRALLEQTSSPDRIIYCDDGSKDGSEQIAREMLGERSNVEYLDGIGSNRGIVARLTEAVARCRDEYLILAPCDDVLHEDAVKIHRRRIEETGTRWSVAAVQSIDESDHPLELCDPVAELETCGGDVLRAAMDNRFDVHGWCFAASLFRDVGGLDPSIPFEDYQLEILFPHATTPAFSSSVVAYYRRRAGTLSNGPVAGHLLHYAGKLALTQVRHRPLFSLRRSSDYFYAAAMHHLVRRQLRPALVNALLSVAVWPSPFSVGTNLLDASRRALRRVTGPRP